MSSAHFLKNRAVQAGLGVVLVGYIAAMGFLAVRILSKAEPANPSSSPTVRAGPIQLEFTGAGNLLIQDRRQTLNTMQEIRGYLNGLAAEEKKSAALKGAKDIPTAMVVSGDESPYRRIHDTLQAARAAGFERFEVRVDDRSTVPVTLPQSSRSTRKPIDPDKPDLDDLEMPAEISILVRPDDQGRITFLAIRSLDGEQVVANPQGLERYLKTKLSDGELTEKAVLRIAATGRTRFGQVCAVLDTCRKTGLRNLVLEDAVD